MCTVCVYIILYIITTKSVDEGALDFHSTSCQASSLAACFLSPWMEKQPGWALRKG
jgi:hypothetical protein